MALSIRLILDVSPGGKEASFLLTGSEATIGRDPLCTIVLEDPSVSSRHGILKPGAGGYTYTDLGSRNGSALARGGDQVRLIPRGEIQPIRPGDVLMLGGAEAPVRLRVHEGMAPFSPTVSGERTIVSSMALADVLVASEALVTLAARALTVPDADALAAMAVEWLSSAIPRAVASGAIISGSGFSACAGSPIPEWLAREALGRREVLVVSEGAGPACDPPSAVDAGTPAAVVAPLIARDGWHGMLVAWAESGASAFPVPVLRTLSVAAPLVALSAASLAVRREGEEARRALEARLNELEDARGRRDETIDPLGTDPLFTRAVSLCRAVAQSEVPVLLLGETGTGKEVLARSIHRWSRRANRSFVAFNCAAVPEALLESELFGHVRGAFTGAASDRRGLFEEADGGTLFLDEIGDMPLPLQSKLLRALQDGEVRRVGATRTSHVDVRIVSATNRELDRQVEKGGFRMDLLYRLNAVTVKIPSLRERPADVLLLAHHLLGRACRNMGKRIPGFRPEALAALAAHDFPGNVRELENEVLRAVALTPEGMPASLEALSIQPGCSGQPREQGLPETLLATREAAERHRVEDALGRAGGNVSQAARELGLSRPGLYKTLERLGLRTRQQQS